MNKPITSLGIAGSLRRESYNRGALRAAQQLVPEGATLDISSSMAFLVSIRTKSRIHRKKWWN